MYNNTTTYFNQRNIRFIALVTIFSIAVVFIATHGFLHLSGSSSSYNYTHTSYNSSLQPTSTNSKGSLHLLASGNYSLEMPMKGGGIESTFVAVPRFMQTIKTKQEPGESKIETVGRGTFSQLASSQVGLIGWDEQNGIQPINPRLIDSSEITVEKDDTFPVFEQAVQIDKQWIGGIVRGEQNQVIPTYYNLATKEAVAYVWYESSEYPVAHREVGGFSMYDSSTKTYRLYTPGVYKEATFKQDIDRAATYDKKPLFSMGKLFTAVVTGSDVTSSDEDENAVSSKSDFKLRIFDTANKKQIADKKINGIIQDVSISPTGDFVYVKTNQSIAIYNTRSLAMVYAAPYIVNDFLWLNNNTFAYATAEHGLFTGSATKSRARTVLPYDTMQPTRLSYVENNWLYFTAYSEQNKGSNHPDAYRVELNSNASPQDKKIIRSFPYQGDGYYVDYINNQAVVQLTRYIDSSGSFVDDDAKNKATAYVNSIFENSVPEIIYDYIDSDLRPESNLED